MKSDSITIVAFTPSGSRDSPRAATVTIENVDAATARFVSRSCADRDAMAAIAEATRCDPFLSDAPDEVEICAVERAHLPRSPFAVTTVTENVAPAMARFVLTRFAESVTTEDAEATARSVAFRSGAEAETTESNDAAARSVPFLADAESEVTTDVGADPT